ncbi:reverse transcriptase domain-containing protein [Tanacetum coccineum]
MTRQKVTQSFTHVSEITFPPLITSSGTEGPLIIEAEIGGHMIHRMYVDGGSSTEVLCEHCFNRLRPEIKSQMVSATTSLTGFSGKTIWPLGQLRLLVTIGDAEHSTKAWMNFIIVRSLSPYNGIIGRHGIKEIQAVPSTAHKMLKFPVDGEIVTIRSTILIPAECATMTTSSKEILKEAEVRHENFKVALHPNFPDQEVEIGGTLSVKGRMELCSLLKENLDIFAWQPSNMTGVPRSRLVDKAFNNQVGQNIEVYVDDLVIKSHTETEMLRDIDETFRTLRKINMKLNPKKCTFGAVEEPFLGYMISPEGINPCPDKTEAVLFLSKLAEKSLPLFKTLKKCIKKSDFHWTPEVEQAFKAISAVLMTESSPLLTTRQEYEGTNTGLSPDSSANGSGNCTDVLIKVLKEKSIQEEEVATVVEEEGPTWMTPIMEYLKDGTLLDDRKEASKLRIKARQYELFEEVLYRRSFLKPLLRKSQVFNSRYGLFYEVDKGEIRGDNHQQSSKEVRVGQHSVLLWPPRRNSLGQRETSVVQWTHGEKAVLPAEIRMPTYRTAVVDAVHNDEELRLNLDLLEERRKRAAISEAKAKLKMTKYYNARVRGVTFRHEDFVYRSNEASHAVDGGKLGPKLEGPYKVTKALGE